MMDDGQNPHPKDEHDKNQIQYEISWASTYIEPWLLEYHIMAGYNPTHKQQIDRETLSNTHMKPWTGTPPVRYATHHTPYRTTKT